MKLFLALTLICCFHEETQGAVVEIDGTIFEIEDGIHEGMSLADESSVFEGDTSRKNVLPELLIHITTKDGEELADNEIEALLDDLEQLFYKNKENIEEILSTVITYDDLEGLKCHCTKNPLQCGCCASFRIHIFKFKKHFNICAYFQILHKQTYGFNIRVIINGRTIFHKEISLRHPPAICINRIPKVKKFVNLCLFIYVQQKKVCMQLIVKFLFIKKHIKLFCFKLPFLAAEDFNIESGVLLEEH